MSTETHSGEATAEAPPDPVAAQLANLGGQLMMLRSATQTAFAQLGAAIGQHTAVVEKGLAAFQTGAPRRAMAAVLYKLFRDLLGHMDQLDALCAGSEADATGWAASVRVARDGFERTLAEYGCRPVAIAVGVDVFDPSLHEALPPEDTAETHGAAEGTIVAVRRRGWRLDDTVLRYPLVIVA